MLRCGGHPQPRHRCSPAPTRILPVTGELHGQRFLVREGTRVLATPLLLALIVVETTDVIFAVDSIPAILAVTTDTFVVFTSNVFALLGMRALYFLLAGTVAASATCGPGSASSSPRRRSSCCSATCTTSRSGPRPPLSPWCWAWSSRRRPGTGAGRYRPARPGMMTTAETPLDPHR